jgi:hypothetical protein
MTDMSIVSRGPFEQIGTCRIFSHPMSAAFANTKAKGRELLKFSLVAALSTVSALGTMCVVGTTMNFVFN